MNYERPDRLPFYQFIAFWPETIHRWYGEGLPPGMSVTDYFSFDKRENIPLSIDSLWLEDSAEFQYDLGDVGRSLHDIGLVCCLSRGNLATQSVDLRRSR